MHWAKIYILLKRNLNLPISPDQQDLLGPFRACFKSVLGPDFGPKSPESYLLGKNRTFPDRTCPDSIPNFTNLTQPNFESWIFLLEHHVMWNIV